MHTYISCGGQSCGLTTIYNGLVLLSAWPEVAEETLIHSIGTIAVRRDGVEYTAFRWSLMLTCTHT